LIGFNRLLTILSSRIEQKCVWRFVEEGWPL
jgi:hypothetical protein